MDFDLRTDFPDYEESTEEPCLILRIDEKTERAFLSAVGGGAREKDLYAFVDQYAATHIRILCFAGTDERATKIWFDRARKVGLQAYLTMSDREDTQVFCKRIEAYAPDGILADGRNGLTGEQTEAMRHSLPENGTVILLVQGAFAGAGDCVRALGENDTVVVCSETGRCDAGLPVEDWLENVPCRVFAELSARINENSYITHEIAFGFAARYLGAGCSGMYLPDLCTDPFDPSERCYDIYETCGSCSEASGARRRHLCTALAQPVLENEETLAFDIPTGKIADGSAVCLICAAASVASDEALRVTVNGNKCEYTGEPVVYACDGKGRTLENICLPKGVRLYEFYVPAKEMPAVQAVRVTNVSGRTAVLAYAEMTVNI